jgi:hypothetical protein
MPRHDLIHDPKIIAVACGDDDTARLVIGLHGRE